MDNFLPGQVYTNLVKMAKYRNIELEGDDLNQTTLAQKLNQFEHVIQKGTRAGSDPRGAAVVCFILVAPGSDFAAKSSDFKKMLKNLPKPKGGVNLEAVVVSEFPLTTHIKKYLLEYNNLPNVMVEDYDYSVFMIEAPLHECVPRHTIATEQEVSQFCREHFTTKERFPKIVQGDIQAIWLGLRPGMVTKIERVSETAGKAIAYRYCI